MGNYNIKIELDKLPGAKIMDIKGDTKTRRCVVIPIDNERGTVVDEYTKFDHQSGGVTTKPLAHVQLLVTAYESSNQSYGSTHYLKPQVSKEFFERMSEDQVRRLPFVGSLSPWGKATTEQPKRAEEEEAW